MSVRCLTLVALAIACAACGPSRPPHVRPDGGTSTDAGLASDGGTSLDGGTSVDAGTPDGGTGGVDGGCGVIGRSLPAGATALKIASWNMEWFGDPTQDPANDALQYQNAVTILRDAGMDLYGLVEVVNPTSWNSLLGDMAAYQGVLASDPSVARSHGCGTYGTYACYSDSEQKPALLYKRSVATLKSAQLILTEQAYNYDLAGRPPLRVDLTVSANGGTTDLVVIVLHLKALATTSDWQRRQAAAADLKQYLDANLVNQKVIVVGDWNDDLDESIVSSNGAPLSSPFQNLLADPCHYTFITQALTNAGAHSTVRYAHMIDHHLVTQPLVGSYVAGSTNVLRPDLWGDPSFALGAYTTTSDHYPVESDYVLGVPAP